MIQPIGRWDHLEHVIIYAHQLALDFVHLVAQAHVCLDQCIRITQSKHGLWIAILIPGKSSNNLLQELHVITIVSVVLLLETVQEAVVVTVLVDVVVVASAVQPPETAQTLVVVTVLHIVTVVATMLVQIYVRQVVKLDVLVIVLDHVDTTVIGDAMDVQQRAQTTAQEHVRAVVIKLVLKHVLIVVVQVVILAVKVDAIQHVVELVEADVVVIAVQRALTVVVDVLVHVQALVRIPVMTPVKVHVISPARLDVRVPVRKVVFHRVRQLVVILVLALASEKRLPQYTHIQQIQRCE